MVIVTCQCARFLSGSVWSVGLAHVEAGGPMSPNTNSAGQIAEQAADTPCAELRACLPCGNDIAKPIHLGQSQDRNVLGSELYPGSPGSRLRSEPVKAAAKLDLTPNTLGRWHVPCRGIESSRAHSSLQRSRHCDEIATLIISYFMRP